MRAVLLFLLLIFHLQATNQSEEIFAATDGEPSSFVEGCVSAITGDFVVSEEDVRVEGLVPIHLKRKYISNRKNWMLFDHHLIAEHRVSGGFVTVAEPNGTILIFVFDASEEKVDARYHNPKKRKKVIGSKKDGKHVDAFPFKLSQATKSSGIVNSSKGGISGRANIKNFKLSMEVDESGFSVYPGDGGERRYDVVPGQEASGWKEKYVFIEKLNLRYRLTKEILPSKHVIFYDYDGHNRLVGISTANKDRTQTYARLTIHYPHPKEVQNYFYIQTSDGKTLHYHKKELAQHKHEYIWNLDAVTSTFDPPEFCSYSEKSKYKYLLLTRRHFPNGRVMDIDYYALGHNRMGANDTRIENESDSRYMRVKELKAPLTGDDSLHPMYSFYYSALQNLDKVNQF